MAHGRKAGNAVRDPKPIVEFLTPLARCSAVPPSVLRAIVEVGGVHKVLSDSVSGYRRGNTWARTVAMRQELFRSIQSPWAVSLDADVVTTGTAVRAAVAFLEANEEYGAVAITYQGLIPEPEEQCKPQEIREKKRGGKGGEKTYTLRSAHFNIGCVVGRGNVLREAELVHWFERIPESFKRACDCYALSEAVIEQGYKMGYLEGYVAADLKLQDRFGYISTPYRLKHVLRIYPLEVKPRLQFPRWLRVQPGSVIRADWYVRGVGVVELPDGRLRWVAARKSVPMPMHDAVGDRARWTDDGRLLPMRRGGR